MLLPFFFFFNNAKVHSFSVLEFLPRHYQRRNIQWTHNLVSLPAVRINKI